MDSLTVGVDPYSMTIGKNNVGAIEYSTTPDSTIHPIDNIEKQQDLGCHCRHKAVI